MFTDVMCIQMGQMDGTLFTQPSLFSSMRERYKRLKPDYMHCIVTYWSDISQREPMEFFGVFVCS